MKRGFDYPLFLVTLFLVTIGLVMVFSASAVLAKERFSDSTLFLKREVIAVVIGFLGLLIGRAIPISWLQRLALPFLFVVVVLMGLVFVPELGIRVGGAARWIRLGPISLQPSELAKLALVLFLANALARRENQTLFRFLSPMVVAGLLIGLTLMGKDLGGAACLAATTFLMMFVGGVRPAVLISEVLLALPALYYLIASVPYRRQRIMSFLNPWVHERGAGFQIIQSYLAFHEGGLFGQGLGEGKQKLFYLPEAHTDFIFSVIGEELGLLGTLTVLGLFVVWLYRAFRIGWRAPDLFSSYLALGIAFIIGIQVLLNCAVVMGLLPTKGLTLPFVSYGGTSLMVTLFLVGLLLNISARRVER